MSETPDMRAGDELKRSREMLERLGHDLDALRQAGAAAAAARTKAEVCGEMAMITAVGGPAIDAGAAHAASVVERGLESMASTAARASGEPAGQSETIEFLAQDLTETT